MDQFDREVEHLERQYDDGSISRKEFDEEMRELEYQYRAAAHNPTPRISNTVKETPWLKRQA